jgi:hypothetical protein
MKTGWLEWSARARSKADQWSRLQVLAVLVGVFGVSRVIFYASGVRFDDSMLTVGWQHLDVELLRHRLLESLLYLHSQPPGYNMFLGAVLKIAGASSGTAFALLHHAMGAALYVATFALMRRVAVPRWFAFGVATVFALSPSFVVYENWLFYTFPLALVLTWSALAFGRAVEKGELGACAVFAMLVALLGATQSLFHLAFVVATVAALVLLGPPRARRGAVLAVVCAPVALLLAVYVKNAVVFDQFVASSWLGSNVAIDRVDAVPLAERELLVNAGALSAVSLYKPFSPPEDYPAEYRAVAPSFARIPALSALRKTGGAPNYNHAGYIAISRRYLADTKTILRTHPRILLRALFRGWYFYFHSSSNYYFLLPQFEASPLLSAERWVYDRLLYGLVPTKGICIFLALGIPLVVAYGARAAWRGAVGLDKAQRALLGYVAVVATYVAVTANLLNATENMRIRFMTDPLLVALLGFFSWSVVVSRLSARWRLAGRAGEVAP